MGLKVPGTQPCAGLSDYKETILGIIPKDWDTVKLGDQVEDLIVPMRDKPKQFNGPIPWCRIDDFDGKYLYTSKNGYFVDEYTISQMNLKVFPKGTVICSCSAKLGICAIAGNPLITNQTFIGIVPKETFDKEFLYYLMVSYARRLQLLSTGTTISYLPKDKFETFIIVKPPLNEQRKIAAILSSVDAAIEQTDAIIAQTERMKKSLMQELFTKGIGNTEFKETKIGSMPETWEFVTLGDVLSKVQYGLSKTGRLEGKYPIIRMNNLSRGHVDISSLQYVDLGEFEYQKYRIEKRDILFNRTNSFDLVGKTSIFNLDGNFVFASYIIRIVCRSERILPDYLNFYLNWDVSQSRLKDVATKGVSQSNINAKSLRNFSIFLPTIPEQLKIAAILSEFESKLCLEKLYRDRLSALKKGLMQNLLTGRVRVKVNGHA